LPLSDAERKKCADSLLKIVYKIIKQFLVAFYFEGFLSMICSDGSTSCSYIIIIACFFAKKALPFQGNAFCIFMSFRAKTRAILHYHHALNHAAAGIAAFA
jgi:hypothetical protein